MKTWCKGALAVTESQSDIEIKKLKTVDPILRSKNENFYIFVEN